MASFAELKELRLRVMELETQTQLALNQLKRQTATVAALNTEVDTKNRRIREQQVGTQSFHNIQRRHHQKENIDVKVEEQLLDQSVNVVAGVRTRSRSASGS